MNFIKSLKSFSPYEGTRPSELGIAIIVGGFGASGSSTIAEMLAEHYHLSYNYGGGMMREIARIHGYDDLEDFFKMDDFISNSTEYDLQVEKFMLQALGQENVLLDSKIGAAIATKLKLGVTLKIWLDAPVEIRAKRVFEKDGDLFPENPTLEERKKLDQNIKDLEYRFDVDKKRYRLLYDIDYDKPEKYNDIVLMTQGMNANQTFDSLLKQIKIDGYLK